MKTITLRGLGLPTWS